MAGSNILRTSDIPIVTPLAAIASLVIRRYD